MKNTPAARGRPRDPERKRRVIYAASQAFLEQGYHLTSMDSIATRSNVTKITIYSYFPDKSALFAACIASLSERLCADIPHLTLDPRQPSAALELIAKQLRPLIHSKDMLDIQRALCGVANTHAAVCASFLHDVPQHIVEWIGSYLTTASQAGSLQIANIMQASEQFYSLLQGPSSTRALLGLATTIPDEDENFIVEGVRMFLARYRPAPLDLQARAAAS